MIILTEVERALLVRVALHALEDEDFACELAGQGEYVGSDLALIEDLIARMDT